MTAIGPIRRLSDPRLEQHLLETLDPEAVQGSSAYGGNLASSSFVSSSPTPMMQTTTENTYNSYYGEANVSSF
jgi:hypothetical protein